MIINSCTLKIRGGVDRDCYGKKAGKGILIQWEKSATLGVSQDQTLFVFKDDNTSRIYDARGNGDGRTSPTITGDHQNRITDYTAIVLETDGDAEVRRLTPLEVERLQGFPDDWTLIGEQGEDGEYYYTDSNGKRKKVTDSARFRALGNSLALPYWKCLARRITAQYERDITVGSLFSGIGGFELAFQKAGAEPLWASEVDEFCIAVTKKHFPEEVEDDERRSD